jgi:hypothetical protein
VFAPRVGEKDTYLASVVEQQTRMPQEHMPKSVEVQILSGALDEYRLERLARHALQGTHLKNVCLYLFTNSSFSWSLADKLHTSFCGATGRHNTLRRYTTGSSNLLKRTYASMV